MKASLSLLSRTQLFTSYRQIAFAFAFLFIIFSLSVSVQYIQYQKLTEFDDYITDAYVEKQYKKRNYWVLKLQSKDEFSFYTTSRDNLKNIEGEMIRLRLFLSDLSFFNFLQGFYAPSQILGSIGEKQTRYQLMKNLESIHSKETVSLYKALYFAGTIPASLRDKLSALGINHLLAISGFHLGVLSFILFFVFKPVYYVFQTKMFPFRNAQRDIAFVVFVLLSVYLYFLDFVPSLLRAYAMSLFAYILYDRGIKIVSFTSLLLVVSFLIALWPKLLFALGFWFSVAGVFHIFLFLHHMKELKPWQSFILLHFWVYVAMLPLVHYFFGSFSLYQLTSPLLTMGFILFYPLSLLLHLLGVGQLLDFVLFWLLNLDIFVVKVFTPLECFFFYLVLSFLATFHRFFFYFLFFFSIGILGYFLYGIT